MDDLDSASSSLLLAPPGPDAAAATQKIAARRRRRREISRDATTRAGLTRSPQTADVLGDLWDGGHQESIRLAQRVRGVATTTQDPLGPEFERDAARTEELHLGLALRCTRAQAAREIRTAHRVCALLPACLGRLEQGEFPAAWFEKLISRTSELEDEAVIEVDRALGASALAVTPESFDRTLSHLVTRAMFRSQTPEDATAEAGRRVVLDPPRPDGTGCLRIIGPIPELLALSHRLDAAAHAVQDAQLTALEDGTQIPGDADGYIDRTLEVPTLAAIRYQLLRGAALDTGPVEVPPDRLRMTVTVPAMTLLGESDAPGMLDGTVPVPAAMARDLAGREPTWYRVLTDPASGRFLPLPADRYTPTAQMLEHLRLRHPTCAVPGCGRPTAFLTETDHIEEFDHDDPTCGGLTDVVNLHRLCPEHHRLKTAGLLDPVRDDDAGRTWWGVTETFIAMQEDGRDLATDQVVAEMTAAWESHQAIERERRETTQRLRDLAENGLSPGDLVRGPDGADDWYIDRAGRWHPPEDPPPF